jgi:hypothetical protein
MKTYYSILLNSPEYKIIRKSIFLQEKWRKKQKNKYYRIGRPLFAYSHYY